MPGTPVEIGPFFGGINSANDPSTIEDIQCADIFNFDIDTDGSLVSRPGFIEVFTPSVSDGFAETLGAYPLTTFQYYGQRFVVVAGNNRANGDEWVRAIDYDTLTATTVISTPSAPYSDALQYDNKLWVMSSAAPVNGGYWTPDGGWTSVGAMPKGIACLTYKERMFIASDTGFVYFSELADFTQWPSSNFYRVGPGDGEKLLAMISFMGQIVLFKENSTYVLAYDSAPENATMQCVSESIGTESLKSVTVHENIIYTFHNNKVYSINNWRWTDVSDKIEISDAPNYPKAPQKYSTGTATLSSVGRRVVVRYRTKHWVYYPDLDSWVRWGTKYDRDYNLTHRNLWDEFLKIPWSRADGLDEYWTGCYTKVRWDGTTAGLYYNYRFLDGPQVLGDSTSTFDTVIKTKMYDYQTPYTFKRLHWWGIDLLSKQTINVKVRPFTYNTSATWNDLYNQGLTWDAANLQGRTWDRPVEIAVDVSDSYNIDYTSEMRTFIKYLKSLRFRKVQFEISSTSDGTTTKGPLRIFSAIAVISNKQLGPKKAN